MKPALYESHCHTPLCRHATGQPEEYARAALDRGLAGITMTCHGPTAYEWGHCMRQDEWPEYLKICRRAHEAFAGRVDVRTGIECDYLPDLEEYWGKFLKENDLSLVLGSVHPQVDEYIRRYWQNDSFAFQKTYFEMLARAAESGLFDALTHPDLVKNTTADDWELERLMPWIREQLDRIAATGVAMELNTSGVLKVIKEMNPAPEILCEIAARKIPLMLGADAHVPGRVAARFEEALDLVEKCGFSHVTYFVERQRRDIPILQARKSLKKVPPSLRKHTGQTGRILHRKWDFTATNLRLRIMQLDCINEKRGLREVIWHLPFAAYETKNSPFRSMFGFGECCGVRFQRC